MFETHNIHPIQNNDKRKLKNLCYCHIDQRGGGQEWNDVGQGCHDDKRKL